MRIVQLANCYGAASGGLRTAVDTLGSGYAAAGHERMLVVPGKQWQTQRDRAGLNEASGVVAPPTATGLAGGVLELLSRPEPHRRAAARRQAERHPWSRAVAEMLEVHTAVAAARPRGESLIAA